MLTEGVHSIGEWRLYCVMLVLTRYYALGWDNQRLEEDFATPASCEHMVAVEFCVVRWYLDNFMLLY